MEQILSYFTDISVVSLEQLAKLNGLYREWNNKINVISRKDIDNLYLHHVLHSLAIAKYCHFKEGETILDVGTGGGFPGIPLAILYPECKFTLADSIGKKIKVVEAIAGELGLKNVVAQQIRVEQLNTMFDYVVSRAVTDLSNFYPWVKGKFNKSILYLKGGEVGVEVELAAQKCKIKRELIKVTDISRYFKEEFFVGKQIIEIIAG